VKVGGGVFVTGSVLLGVGVMVKVDVKVGKGVLVSPLPGVFVTTAVGVRVGGFIVG
jgi:hypothetical protein